MYPTKNQPSSNTATPLDTDSQGVSIKKDSNYNIKCPLNNYQYNYFPFLLKLLYLHVIFTGGENIAPGLPHVGAGEIHVLYFHFSTGPS